MLAFIGKQAATPCVIRQGAAKSVEQVVSNFIQNGPWNIVGNDDRRIISAIAIRPPRPCTRDEDVIVEAAVEVNAHVFDRVKDAATQRIPAKLALEQSAFEADGCAGPRLIIDTFETLIIRFVVVKLGQQ